MAEELVALETAKMLIMNVMQKCRTCLLNTPKMFHSPMEE
jgi:hypothetical protein